MGLLRSLSSLRSDSLDLSAKTVIMTPMVHLLLLPLLFSIAGGKDLEEKKGPFENTVLDVPEGTPVPYPMHQFQVTHPGVNNFRLSGEGRENIKMSKDGCLYLEKSLDWSQEDHYIIMVEALADDEVVEAPISVIIKVLDVNNNAPYFNQTDYTAVRRKRNVNPLEDPDYTLIVRVQDLGGESETALSGNTRVHIVVQQNLWFNPGPIIVKENLLGNYPMVIAKVQSNDPDAIYSLVQKERELKFPFQITEDGEILLTEQLDREDKNMYILVVFAKDNNDQEVEEPLEIQVIVDDVNDNAPVCEKEESVFEVQENEPVGSLVVTSCWPMILMMSTLNAQLTYTIPLSQNPPTTPIAFSIDAASGAVRHCAAAAAKKSRPISVSKSAHSSLFSLRQPLDYESSKDYSPNWLRNPEPRMKTWSTQGIHSLRPLCSPTWMRPRSLAWTSWMTVPENTTKGLAFLWSKGPRGQRSDNPEKSSERVLSVRRDRTTPQPIEKQAFICERSLNLSSSLAPPRWRQEPFSKPFHLYLAHGKKTPNWDLKPMGDTAAALTLEENTN
ncbi:cadherin-17 [Lates japonicus]|uniref:Cadherin-17 n=1 Tax=Lates japonicus TaxID=270547 RepID=A0AAD3RD55_LATJO|nr:cadherin-17 [Lates japonicus]